jgi:uncharacterized membrane protein
MTSVLSASGSDPHSKFLLLQQHLLPVKEPGTARLKKHLRSIAASVSPALRKSADVLRNSGNAEVFFWLLCVGFFTVACLQSLTLHYQFFSNNADLGFHNHLMYKFSHLKAPSTTLWNVNGTYLGNCFGDHVTGLMPLNSQLYWIFGSYALLLAQIGYMVAGARGLYKLISFKCGSTGLALFGVLLFFTHYSVYAALDFDAHDNVYGMMFLPWILYHYYRKNMRGFILCLLIFLIARDDLALTGICMGLSLLIFDWKKDRRYGLTCFLVSLGYFILAFYVIIPNLSPFAGGGYNAWRFAALGNNIPEVIQTVFTRPLYTLRMFVDDPAKQDKFIYFLWTGGALMLFQPRFILFVFPTFFVTCMSYDWGLWGNMNHYNIVFSVVLPFVIALCVYRLRSAVLRGIILLLALHFNIKYLNENFFRDWSHFDRIYSSEFYHKRKAAPEIREMLTLIPPDAPVSATSHLTPHLAFRDKAYWYPDVNDAEYIAINADMPDAEFYPMGSADEFKASIDALKTKQEWELLYDKKGVLLFKKKK